MSWNPYYCASIIQNAKLSEGRILDLFRIESSGHFRPVSVIIDEFARFKHVVFFSSNACLQYHFLLSLNHKRNISDLCTNDYFNMTATFGTIRLYIADFFIV